jgi:hypothetical protein
MALQKGFSRKARELRSPFEAANKLLLPELAAGRRFDGCAFGKYTLSAQISGFDGPAKPLA